MPPDPPAAPRVGPCRLVREVGSGEFGAIHAGELEQPLPGVRPNQAVRVHLVSPPDPLPPTVLGELARRVELLSRLRHPHLVRPLATGLEPGPQSDVVYVVTEPVGAQPLRELLSAHGTLEEATVLRLATQAAWVLAELDQADCRHGSIDLDHLCLTDDHSLRVQGAETRPLRAATRGDKPPSDDLADLGRVLRTALTGRADGDLAALEIAPFLRDLVAALVAPGRPDAPADAPQLLATLTAAERSDWWRTRRGDAEPSSAGALHGRRRELSQLDHAFGQAQEGQARVILLEGDAGSGKRRLISEFVDDLRLREVPHTLLRGSFDGDRDAPGAALVAACRKHFPLRSGAPDPLVPFLGRQPDLLRAFRALLEGDEVELPPQRLGAALVRIVRKLASSGPLLVVVDAFDRAGPGAAGLLSAVAKATRGHGVLLVVSTSLRYPTNWLSALADEGALIPMALGRLEPTAIQGLLRDVAGTWPPRSRREEIARRSEGLPGFAHALIRSAGPLTALDDSRPIPLPFGVRETLVERLESLGSTTLAVLGAAACLGRRFDPEIVAAATGERPQRLLSRLRRAAASRRIVRRVSTDYEFVHPLLHETVLSRLDESERRAHHLALAEELTRRVASATPRTRRAAIPTPDVLAHHFLSAAEPERAEPHVDRGLARLERLGLDERLAELAALALEMAAGEVDRVTVARWRVLRAGALFRLGRRMELGRELAAAQRSLEGARAKPKVRT